MLLLVASAFGADVLVFGDSWAEGSADELQDALDRHGLTVAPYGIGGTTADQYANVYPTAIPTVVATHPEARWVWLSLGGNDLFTNYAAGNGAANASLYDANFRTVLDQIVSVRPDIRVVSFGYDFVNFEQSTDCIATAWAYFGTGTLTPTINGYFLADIGNTLLGIDPGRFRYTYVDQVWGTLQAAGGMATAPDANYPSPSHYMADCIHPTGEGYRLVHDVLVDAYWGVAAPTPAIAGPTTVCVGDQATWTDSSVGTTDTLWSLDGVESSLGTSLVRTFEVEGAHVVALTAAAGAWEATASIDVVVDPCFGDDSGASDSAVEEDSAGNLDSGGLADTADEATSASAEGECGCGTVAMGGIVPLLPALALIRRRGRVARYPNA